MEIGRPFNTFTKQEYAEILPQHKKYKDFNTLGLYRSIVENDKLNLEDKFEVRDLANEYFQKTFDFLVIKDPRTWMNLTYLGEEFTRSQEWDIWQNIIEKQEKIFKEKRFGHRNFGMYSKHDCGVPHCPYDGLMVHPKSDLAESHIHFKSDKKAYEQKIKSKKRKSDRKKSQRLIDRDWDLD